MAADKLKYAWVVDDLAMYRNDLKDTLQRQGFLVRTFNEPLDLLHSLESAVENKRKEKLPNVIVADFDFVYGEGDLKDYNPEKWKKFDGSSITKVMKELPATHHIPVIFCSGEGSLKYYEWPKELKVYHMGKAKDSPQAFVDLLHKALGMKPPAHDDNETQTFRQ